MPKYSYIPRDLSWLSFNGRVLQEANDPSVPLKERIRFLGIFSPFVDKPTPVLQYKKIYWLHWWDEGAPYRRKLQWSITLFIMQNTGQSQFALHNTNTISYVIL